MAISAQQAARKYVANYKESAERRAEGAKSPREHPGQAANKVLPKMAAAYADAAKPGGRIQRGNQSYTTGDWGQAYIEKGIPNGDRGVDTAEDMMADMIGQLQTAAETIKRGLPPRKEKGNNEARMTQFSREMRKRAGTFRKRRSAA